MEKKENPKTISKSPTTQPELRLDDWQKQLLQIEGDLLLCTGRRVGKTTIFAMKAAERMVKKPGTEIVAVSLTEDQAYIMHSMVLHYLETHYKKYLNVPKKDKPTKNKINLNNRSTYRVRPVGNTGDAIRGFNANVLIIDEASRIPKTAWTAARPTLLTTGGEIWMCSTPFGKQGYFWEQFKQAREDKDPEARFRVFHISSEEAITERPISETWTKEQRDNAIKNLEKEKKDMSELQYGQEYLGLFMDELRRFFSDEWIDKVCTSKREEVIYAENYYLGVDIARLGGDETSFSIIRKANPEKLLHTYQETATKKLTTWTEKRILELDSIYQLQKIYIDAGAGSLGVGIFDQLMKHEQTKRKTEAINNRKIVLDREGKSKQRILKEDLYDNLRALGERGEIYLLDEENVRLSLRSVQYEFLVKSNQPTQMRIFGDYTHIAESLIRAAWSSKEKSINAEIYYI